MQKLLALLATLAAGCSVISHEKVEGWPELQIVEHYVPNSVMRDKCAPYVGFGMSPEACAEFDLAATMSARPTWRASSLSTRRATG